MSHQGYPPGAPSGPPPPGPPPFIGPPGHGGPGYGSQQPPPPPPPRKGTNPIIWVVVIVGLLMGCGVISSISLYGVRRYLQKSEEAKRDRDRDDASDDDDDGDEDEDDEPRDRKTSKGGGKLLRSTDGVSEITLPRGFRSMPELETEGVIRAGDNVGNQFAIVITEPKTDFAQEVDLEKYGEMITTAMKSKLTNPKVSAGTPLKIGSLPGIQFEINGSVDLISITYLVTIVDGAKHFHQVLIWTSPSKFAGRKSAFQRATATFREL